MKYSSNYSEFLDDVIGEISSEDSQRQEIKGKLLDERSSHDKELEERFNLTAKRGLLILIGALFCLSYIILIATLWVVFFNEAGLIKAGYLDPADRTVNTNVIMVFTGGTISQTAVSFVLLVKYFFHAKVAE